MPVYDLRHFYKKPIIVVEDGYCPPKSAKRRLIERDIIMIRDDGRPPSTIAREYGISSTCVAMIRARKIWKSVP